MADDLPDAAFWLPSDFLTDADILSDFDLSQLSATGNETSSEDDDLRGLSSPQSTLFEFESKNSGSSPDSPNDEKNDDSIGATLDLLKKAAGEVAKMTKVVTSETSNNGNYSGERLFYPPPFLYRNYPSEMMWGPAAPQQQQQQSKVTKKKKNKKNNNGNNRNNGALGLPQSAWPPLPGKAQSQAQTQAQTQTQTQPMLGPFIILKRESVGTGVFLPRHVASPAEPKNKSDGIATETKTDNGSQQQNSRQVKTNQDDIRLPPEWVY